jgi:DNA-binding response OmpR family regulator
MNLEMAPVEIVGMKTDLQVVMRALRQAGCMHIEELGEMPEVLARHAPDVVDYQTLAAEAQGYQTDAREAQELVKWHIHHIRQAIEPNPQNPAYIINVRGRGHRFVPE